jgi:hypothetical protein
MDNFTVSTFTKNLMRKEYGINLVNYQLQNIGIDPLLNNKCWEKVGIQCMLCAPLVYWYKLYVVLHSL